MATESTVAIRIVTDSTQAVAGIDAVNAKMETAAEFTLRAKAAEDAYNQAAKGTVEVQAAMGAAFDQASASGATYVEALEAAVAAAGELTGATGDLTGATAASTAATKAATAATFNHAEAYGSARVAAGAFTGSMGAMDMGLARLAASSATLGPLLNAAMPVMVGIAAVAIVVQLGEAFYKAFDIGGERARALQKDIEDTDLSMRRMTDDIILQTLKLQDEQAKLEKKPFQNGIALSLTEATAQADALAEKLDSIDSKFAKNVIAADAGSMMQRLTFGGGNTDYEQTMLSEHQKWLAQANNTTQQLSEVITYGKSLQTRLGELQQKHAAAIGSDAFVNYGNELNAVQQMIEQQKAEQKAIQKTIAENAQDAATEKAREAAAAAAAAKPHGGAGGGKDDAQRQQQEAIQETARLENQAIDASLSGYALAAHQRDEEIAQTMDRLADLHHSEMIPDAVREINAKFYADQAKLAATAHQQLEREMDDFEAKATAQIAEEDRKKQEQAQKDAEAAQRATEVQERIADQEAQYAARASEATRHARRQGLSGWVSDNRAAVDAIEAQQDAELQKLDKLCADEKMTFQQYEEAKTNIERAANAQVAAANQEMAHQIAGTLEQAYANPVEFIKKQMKQIMFEILAQWVESLGAFQKIFGSTMGGLHPGEEPGGLMGKIMGHLTPHHAAQQQQAGPSAETVAADQAHYTRTMAAKSAPDVTVAGASSAPQSSVVVGAAPSGPDAMQSSIVVGNSGAPVGYAGAPQPVSSPVVGAGTTMQIAGGAGAPDITVGAAPISGISGAGRGSHAAISGGAGFSLDSGIPVGYAGGSQSISSPVVGAGTTAQIAGVAGTAGHAVSAGGGTASTVGSMVSGGAGLTNTLVGAHSALAAQRAATSAAAPLGAPGAAGLDQGGGVDDGTGAKGAPLRAPTGMNGKRLSGGAATAATAIGDAADVGMGGYEGYTQTMSDFHSGSAAGTMKGMLGDAAAGAMIGSVLGPMGTLVGAGVGAVVGLAAGVTGAIMGEGGRLAARTYYEQKLFPAIEKIRNGGGSTDFQSAISDINRTASDGLSYMNLHWGGAAAQWVDDNYLKKEQQLADSEIEARAKGGSYAVGMSAKQFHTGGEITGFGGLGTSSTEGFVHAMMGETVMNPSASASHGSVLQAMNSGASATDVARMYLAGSGGGGATASAAAGGTAHTWNVNALDGKSFDQFLANGGARTVVKHVNSFATQYAGDGISG